MTSHPVSRPPRSIHRDAGRAGMAAGIGAVLVLALAGCAAIENTLHKTHEEAFDTVSDARADWVGVPLPAWVPADATALKNYATDDETNAIIRVTSPSDLATVCPETERTGIPFDGRDWAPELDAMPDTVFRCGVYEVIATDDGWFGWYAATEPGQTPTEAARTDD